MLMHKYYYEVLKLHYGNAIELVYMDADTKIKKNGCRNRNESDDSDISTIVSDVDERKDIRRKDLIRRAKLIELEQEEKRKKNLEKLIVPNIITEQIEKSEFELKQIIEEALVLISENKLKMDDKECSRKINNDIAKQKRFDSITLILSKLNDAFMNIDDELERVSNKNDILIIHNDIKNIREQGIQLMKQKDNIIKELIKEIDDTISKSLREKNLQNYDLAMLYKIADNHLNDIKKIHNENLNMIIDLMNKEMQKKQLKDVTSWDLLFDQIIDGQMFFVEERLRILEDKEKNLMIQFEENEEKAKNSRINAIKEFDERIRELEFVKIKCFENTEKLQYNYDVLKKRTEENAIALASRKRLINAMRQTVYDLKAKLEENDKQYKSRIPILKQNIIQINSDIDRLENKVDIIAKIEAQKFENCWAQEQTQIINIIEQIYNIDRVIHNKYLGIEWDSKNLFGSPCMEDIHSYKKIANTLTILNKKEVNGDSTAVAVQNKYIIERDKALMRLILDLTVKESHLTVDENLIEIIRPYRMKNLPIVYNVIKTLGLSSADSWDLFKSNFRPFVQCAVCDTQVNWIDEQIFSNCSNIYSTELSEKNDSLLRKLSSYTSTHNNFFDNGLQKHLKIENYIEKPFVAKKTKFIKQNNQVLLCNNLNHRIFIDETNYLRIMKRIIEKAKPKPKTVKKSLKQRLNKQYNHLLWIINEQDIESYWAQFTKNFSLNKLEFWDIVVKAMQQYYDVLIGIRS
ncbi:dynein regulatory complex protein 1-like [Daktulosphaira vitifoliae]|uniref:dynein regulatory complex protein 1-like n=1 Tax=Daktulosphaira vitifoliae TaxID=58002 RepID=UPI0021A9F2B9|nr:dynein regulatory complex protein 1-like [Daktulosphaira vitifoliae]